MNKSAPYALIGLGVILMAGIAWWFGFKQPKAEPLAPAPEPIAVSEGLSIYTNGEHGFLIAYPEAAEISELFESSHLAPAWRVHALPQATGEPLLSITTYRVENESAYPRYFEALIRLGVSADAQEVAQCLVPREAQGEVPLPDRMLADTVWKAFSFGDAAMMKYVKGISYRTVKDGACYALEQIAVGSTYREEATSEDIPDSILTAEYEKLDIIIESFRFAR